MTLTFEGSVARLTAEYSLYTSAQGCRARVHLALGTYRKFSINFS